MAYLILAPKFIAVTPVLTQAAAVAASSLGEDSSHTLGLVEVCTHGSMAVRRLVEERRAGLNLRLHARVRRRLLPASGSWIEGMRCASQGVRWRLMGPEGLQEVVSMTHVNFRSGNVQETADVIRSSRTILEC